MNILGISSFYHDSAACVVKDGVITAAAQEERFNRVKNTSRFPMQAINYCVQASDLSFYDLDLIGFYEKPYLKFHRVITNHLRSYPFSLRTFLRSVPNWLQDRLVVPLILKKEIGFEGQVLFIKHHLSHAASSFLVSPFEEAAILTADGVGEWATTAYGVGRGRDIKILKELSYPHSLGLLYTAVTTYLGYDAHGGEGKTMGLAGHGKPRYLDRLKQIVDVRDDGSYHLDTRYLAMNKGDRMYGRRFVDLFGPARRPGEELDERHCDIAASVQLFVEETLLSIVRHLHQEVGGDDLCLAGGVFLNCVANNRILEETPFKRIFVQAAAGDCGGALGVALYIHSCLKQQPRTFQMDHAFLGPEFTDSEIHAALASSGLTFRQVDEEELGLETAKLIEARKVVGWFQGRMEIGPRALGCRSIIGDPRDAEMKDAINNKVKHREPFRPFAPAVLEERANDYFEMTQPSPFMLLSPRIRPERVADIPAVNHVDGSARVQTVTRETNPRFYDVIKAFEERTGVAVIINTSFNRNGEPIVCTPRDAVACFSETEMDCLVIGTYIVEKEPT